LCVHVCQACRLLLHAAFSPAICILLIDYHFGSLLLLIAVITMKRQGETMSLVVSDKRPRHEIIAFEDGNKQLQSVLVCSLLYPAYDYSFYLYIITLSLTISVILILGLPSNVTFGITHYVAYWPRIRDQ